MLPLPSSDLVDAGRWLADALEAKAWRVWAARLREGLSRSDEAERAEGLGQALELFRKSGPGRFGKAVDPIGTPDDELETLIASTGPYWPQRP